ncbi:MAG: DUF1850 domain-containing protein [Dialister sp.]|nr:DUF1850 domain-containing protein [Dialister sp.]
MKRRKNTRLENVMIVIGVIVCLICTVGGYMIRQTYLFGETKDGFIIRQRVNAGTPVTLAYHHSVQKTMVYEYLEVNRLEDGFILKSTKYQSLGAGLPFTPESGTLRREGEWFIIDDINKPYPTLSIRNGVTNEGHITIGDTDYALSDVVPLGKELYLYVAPLYKSFYLKKEIRS